MMNHDLTKIATLKLKRVTELLGYFITVTKILIQNKIIK